MRGERCNGSGMDTNNAEKTVLPQWVCPKIEEFDVEAVTEGKLSSPTETAGFGPS